jgi:hypothetical protein
VNVVGWALPALLAAAPLPDRTAPALLELFDLDGRRVRPLEDAGTRGVVFILARTDCPISNRYAPELQRLHRRFAPAGVVFRLVYVEPSEAVDDIRRHLR